MTVSLAEGGDGLGAMWGEEKTREYLQKAGFRSIATHRLVHDIQNNTSGLLQFRRLQIVERVTRVPSALGRIVFTDPLKRAWFIAHRDIRPGPYWSLFEKNKDAPWAEEIANTVGLRVIPSDECYSDCALSKIVQGPLQYWTRYPNGNSIREALQKAISHATYAIETSIYNAPPQPTLNEIRRSLANVTAPEKRRLLDLLDEADRKYSARR